MTKENRFFFLFLAVVFFGASMGFMLDQGKWKVYPGPPDNWMLLISLVFFSAFGFCSFIAMMKGWPLRASQIAANIFTVFAVLVCSGAIWLVVLLSYISS